MRHTKIKVALTLMLFILLMLIIIVLVLAQRGSIKHTQQDKVFATVYQGEELKQLTEDNSFNPWAHLEFAETFRPVENVRPMSGECVIEGRRVYWWMVPEDKFEPYIVVATIPNE